MDNAERKRLLKLREDTDEATFNNITKMLYDEAPTYQSMVTLRIVDPILELEGVTGGQHSLRRFVTEAILEELGNWGPEWFQPGQGASWWVDAYWGHPGNNHNGMWLPIGDGDVGELPPKRAQANPDTAITFATIKEGLEWAISYISANADEVRELLDE